MNQVDSIIFDLDGTLWDTCDACAQAWNVVLERGQIPYRTISGDDVSPLSGVRPSQFHRFGQRSLPHSLLVLLPESAIA
jgi:beta-phosphoglucomutase-like phosphatase (HAD superfamily)